MRILILAGLVALALVFGAKGCSAVKHTNAPAPSQTAAVTRAVQRDWDASDAGFRAGKYVASEQPGLGSDSVRALAMSAHVGSGYSDRQESFVRGFINGYNYQP